MNSKTKRLAEFVAKNIEDEEASRIINDLLDEIENLEYQLNKANEEISNLQLDVEKWSDEARDWEDKYYEAQNP